MTNGVQDPKPSRYADVTEAALANTLAPRGSRYAALTEAVVDLSSKRAHGIDWLAQFGLKAGASLADTAVRGVDSVTRGWALIGQHVQNLLTGEPTIEGKGVSERLTGRDGAEFVDVLASLGIRDPEQRPDEKLGDYARRIWQEKLGPDGYMAASLAGELAGFAAPSGPMALIGRGAAPLGAALAGPVQRFYARKVLEGRMNPEIVRELAKNGQLLAEMARQGGWSAKVTEAIPGLVGEYGALLAQTYAMAPRGEGQAAVEHTLVPGMAFLGIARGGRWIGSRLLDRSLSPTAKNNLLAIHDAMQNGTRGRAGSTWNAFRSLPMADKLRVLGVQGGVSAVEAMGFSLTDKGAVMDLIGAYSGDPDAWDRAVARFAGTWAGVAVIKGGLPLDAVPYFKRVAPDLNSWRMEVAKREQQRQEQQAAELETAPQAELPRLMHEEHARSAGAAERARERFEVLPEEAATKQGQEGVRQQIQNDQAVARLVDPLLRSGFTMEEPRLDQPTPTVRLREPGGADVLVHVQGAGRPRLSISQRLWEIVARPEAGSLPPGEAVGGRLMLDGPAAEQFLTDLGLRAAAMRMRATLRFGREGFDEAPFAEGWRDPSTGMDYAFSLDGEPMRRDPSDGRWHAVPAGDQVRALLDLPVGERVLEPAASYFSPGIEQWAQFLREKQRSFPEEAVDEVLEMALSTAQFGGNTQSANELRRFFEAIPPELFASKLGPQTSKAMAHTVAAMGAGLTNAQAATATLDGIQIPAQTGLRPLLTYEAQGEGVAAEAGTQYTAAREPAVSEAPAGAPAPREPVAAPAGARAAGAGEAPGEPGLPRPGAARGGARDPAAPDRARPDDLQGGREPQPVTLSDALLGPRPAEKALPAGREGEAGRLRAPDVTKLARMVEGAGAVPSRYAEPLARAVARKGGKEARRFGTMARETLSRTRSLLGEIDPQRLAAERAAAGPVSEFAEGTKPLGKHGEVRLFRELVEDRLAEADIPTEHRAGAAELKEAAQGAIFGLGRQAERAGVRQLRGGKYEPFTVTGRKGILPRTAGKDFAEVMDTPALRKRFAENVASHAENNTTVEQVLAVITPGARKMDPLEREAQYEQARQWPIQPDIVVAPDGRKLDVWESRPGPAIEALVHKQTARTASVEVFGQDLPKHVREEFGLKEGVQPVLERVRAEMGEADFAAAKALAARMQGVGTGGLGRAEGLATLEGVRRAAQTVRSFIYDATDPWNVVPSFFGFGKLFRAIAEDAGSIPALRAAYAEAVRFGSIIRDMGNYAISEATEASSLIRDVLTAPGRLSEKTKQLLADIYVKRAIADWKEGRATIRDRMGLERLGYEPAEIDALLSGTASPQLYTRVRHEFVQQATSNFRPGEGSYAHQSRLFNFLVPYQRFFTGRLWLTAQAMKSFGEAWRSGDPKRIRVATSSAIHLALGAMVSGGVSKWLAYLLSGRGTDEFVRDLSYAPAAFLMRGAAEQMIGGLLLQTATALWDARDLREEVGRTLGPAQPVFELVNAASGTTSYRGQSWPEKLVTLAERVGLGPISQTGSALAAAVGITEDPETHNAVRRFYQWPGRKGGSSEPENEALWAQLRRVALSLQGAIDQGTGTQDPQVVAGLQKALGLGTGENIANSLLGRRIVHGLDSAQLRDLVDFMGEGAMGKLYAYDNALTLLADQYRAKPGTAEPREPLEQELQLAIEQARLGNEASWRPLMDRVLDQQAERLASGSLDMGEVRALARAMALFPDTLGRALSDRQAMMLKMAGRGGAQMMLESILMQSAKDRAGNRLRARLDKK